MTDKSAELSAPSNAECLVPGSPRRLTNGGGGAIAVPAVEGWQLLYFGGAKNNVGLSLFRESRFMDRVIAPVVSAVSQKVPIWKAPIGYSLILSISSRLPSLVAMPATARRAIMR